MNTPMTRDTILSLELGERKVKDELKDLLRVGAQHLLKKIVEEELRSFLVHHSSHSPEGYAQVVRNE